MALPAARQGILLLSDLHLPSQASPLREGFLRFLAGPARSAAAVYILGDLFEFWVGDDLGLLAQAPEAQALAALAASGVAVFFQPGNRDFLIGEAFFAATGVQPLADPCAVDLLGCRTILSHGDIYCSDDLGYQRWRRFSRSPAVQRLFRALPSGLRLRIAGAARQRSEGDKLRKPADIMDVNSGAIESSFAALNAGLMIHGHTHRPASELYASRALRIVLPDWRPDRMMYLRCEPGADTSVGTPLITLESVA